MAISTLVKFCDRVGIHWVARSIIFIVYLLKGKKIKNVKFNAQLSLWEYQVGKSFFLTQELSWFSSDEYYLMTLQRYAGFFYMPTLGDMVIDVGAGVGEEVQPVARLVGPTGKVFAIEANPRTFGILAYFCKKNHLANVNIFQLAITEKAGHVFIDDDGAYGVQNSISNRAGGAQFKVESISLDDFIDGNSIAYVDLLKVNIEGAEQFLVKGMSKSLFKIRRVAISCHDFRFNAGESEFYRTRENVVSFLQKHFNIFYQKSGDPVRDNYVYGVNKNCTNASSFI